MTSQSLYRKWRSRNFAEIVGQHHVTRTLKNALLQDRMSHAYLFCGPRGIGKTSAARILAKAANCENPSDGEPCNSCSACRAINEGRCLDVMEIDAASNRSIDDIRDLREKINFSPSEARFKFYILDEVHMLSNDAFNALLKTLEEPPPHAVFVLVTTESHKLPATVLSRCQRFDFRRIGLPDLVGRLKHVCFEEGIQIDAAAVELVARLSTGSLRDAESLLDQLVSYCGNTINLEDVHMVVGMTGSEAAKRLVEHIVGKDITAGLKLINEVAGGGADLRQFGREIIEYMRKLMLLKVGGLDAGLTDLPEDALAEMKVLADKASAEHIIRSIRLLSAIEGSQRVHSHSQLPLELAFVESALQPGAVEIGQSALRPMRAASDVGSQTTESAAARSITSPHAVHPPQPQRAQPQPPRQPSGVGTPDRVRVESRGVNEPEKQVTRSAAPDVVALVRDWNNVLAAFSAVDKRIQALLRDCRPVEIDGDTVVLGFFYQFHVDAVTEQSKRAVVEKVLSDFRGTPSRIKCIFSPREKTAARSPTDDPLVKAAVSMGARIKKVEVRPEDTG